MFNTYAEFEKTASFIKEGKDINAIVKKNSLTNQLAYTAYAIYATGSNNDKQSLAASIAKGAQYETFKGACNKAKQVFEYLNAGHSISLDDVTVSLADINTMLDEDVIPETPISTLYAALKGEAKQESASEKRAKAIKRQAMANMQAAHPEVVLTKAKFDAHPERIKFEAIATQQVDARLAAEAQSKALESQETMLNRIVNEILSNNLTAQVIAALTSGKAQAIQETTQEQVAA